MERYIDLMALSNLQMQANALSVVALMMKEIPFRAILQLRSYLNHAIKKANYKEYPLQL